MQIETFARRNRLLFCSFDAAAISSLCGSLIANNTINANLLRTKRPSYKPSICPEWILSGAFANPRTELAVVIESVQRRRPYHSARCVLRPPPETEHLKSHAQ